MQRLIKAIAWLLAHIPRFSAQFITLGPGHVGRWYNRNGMMKYPVGAVLELGPRYAFGYGMRPVGVVVAHEKEADGADRYVLEMTRDTSGDFFKWIESGYVPADVQRETQRESHFKWNIENHFRRIVSPADAYTPQWPRRWSSVCRAASRTWRLVSKARTKKFDRRLQQGQA